MRIRVALRREKPRGGAPGRHRQPASAPASVLSPSCWQEGYFQVSRKYLLEEGYVLTGVCFFFLSGRKCVPEGSPPPKDRTPRSAPPLREARRWAGAPRLSLLPWLLPLGLSSTSCSQTSVLKRPVCGEHSVTALPLRDSGASHHRD